MRLELSLELVLYRGPHGISFDFSLCGRLTLFALCQFLDIELLLQQIPRLQVIDHHPFNGLDIPPQQLDKDHQHIDLSVLSLF